MAVDRAKKLKTAESVASEGGLERIDGGLVLSIEKLQAIQEELDKVDEEANDRVFEVEQKYNEIRRPVYVRRCDIIKRIPDFWLSSFLSHPALGDLLNETDQQIFKFLSSLDVEDLKDVKAGYTITFNFSANPYFKDTKLTKTYLFNGDGTTKVSGTTINWKEGMENIANGKVQEKGGKRPISEESFFSWFSESQQEDSLGGFMDEVAEIIKEDLWPNPVKYFNNNEPDEENIDGEEETDDEHSNDDDVTAEEDD